MNRALEMWKEVTDSTEDVSASAKSACYSTGKAYYSENDHSYSKVIAH